MRKLVVRSVSSADADLLIRELLGPGSGALPTNEQGFMGKFEKIEFGCFELGFLRSRGRIAVRHDPVDSVLLMFCQPDTPAFEVNDSVFDADSVCVVGAGGVIGMTLPDPANLVFLQIRMHDWRAAHAVSANPDLLADLSEGAHVIVASGGVQSLSNVVAQARRTVATRGQHSSDRDAAAREKIIITTAVKAVSARSNRPARRVASSHLVGCFRRALVCVEKHLPEGITVSELCRETDIHERTLQMAFRTLADMTPGQYIRFRRLAACRRRLTEAFPDEATVSGIAMEFGFIYPSQFASYYRKVYGEKPSTTLRRNPRQLPSKVRERQIGIPGQPSVQLASQSGAF